MKKIIFSLLMCIATINVNAQLKVYTGNYYESSVVRIQLKIENYYNNPIWVNYIKVKNLNKNSTVYYSDDPIIINSIGGMANAWESAYDFTFECNNNDGQASIFKSKYEIEICYVEVYDGAKMKIDKFYTTSSIGMELQTTGISNITINTNSNKYYDLSGKLIETPEKGKVCIHNNKKIIY